MSRILPGRTGRGRQQPGKRGCGTVASNKDAEKMAPAPEDRMVRGCAVCPPSQPSKKKKKGNPKIAAELFAQPLGSLDQVRQAVDLVLGK